MLQEVLGDFIDVGNNEKEWIVHQTQSEGLVELVSKANNSGIIPIGTFLTIEDGSNKFFLRVEKSTQEEIFKPSILLVEANLELPNYEQKIKNIVLAQRVNETSSSLDDSSSFIRPGLLARRSTQEEVNEALKLSKEGVQIFLATASFGKANILKGLNGTYITARLPVDAFYHQIIVAGKTGSGKTTALKYLAQYFAEELHGAVIAVNVKGNDLLFMNKPSRANDEAQKEWKYLDKSAHGVDNFIIYVPYSNRRRETRSKVDPSLIKKISLSVNDIEPETLTALMRNLSDIAETVLPDIFRYWLEEERTPESKFMDFVTYFNLQSEERGIKEFKGRTIAGGNIEYPIATSTYNAMLREINKISQYFDASESEAEVVRIEELIQRNTISVLDLAHEDMDFGAILLRHIVKKIREYMPDHSTIPVLFIIDETHIFYDSKTSQDALNDLSAVCRTGRQYKTAIIFSSQSPRDIPQDLESVVATKIFFQSERREASAFGLSTEGIDVETLPKGVCTAKIYDQPYMRLLKFPLAFGGVDNE